MIHLHPVPQAVHDLLAVAGAHATGPLTVILERDGAYPPIGTLLDELDAPARGPGPRKAARVSRPALEAFLARLYVDDAFRAAFLADPGAAAKNGGLTAAEAAALEAIDREGLALAAESFAHKRNGRPTGARRR